MKDCKTNRNKLKKRLLGIIGVEHDARNPLYYNIIIGDLGSQVFVSLIWREKYDSYDESLDKIYFGIDNGEDIEFDDMSISDLETIIIELENL